MKTVFLRVLDAEDKAVALRHAISQPDTVRGRRFFEVNVADFAALPKSPFAYWVSERVRHLFIELSPFQNDGRVAAVGASTKDDGRFLRTAWEVPNGDAGNVPFAKGGRFRPFFDDIYLCIRWRDDGAEAKAFVSEYRRAHGWSPHWKAELHNSDLYFHPGLTWPSRTNGLSMRVLPTGCIFASKGPAVFVANDDTDQLLAVSSVVNSRVFFLLLSLQLARTELAQSFEVGLIQSTPFPQIGAIDQALLAKLARRAWSLKRSLDIGTETSHAFILPALLQAEGNTFVKSAAAWTEHVQGIQTEFETVQLEIDEHCYALYNISQEDRQAIARVHTVSLGNEGKSEEENDEQGTEDDDREAVKADPAALAAGLVSWAVGVAAGRFDVRLATGGRERPIEPNPFDRLPTCSPAMLTPLQGSPGIDVPADYSVEVSPVLVDDPGHRLDITRRVRAVFDVVFGGETDRWWTDVGAALGVKSGEVGSWLRSGFFDYHLQMYSKSRRKAPILWPIGTRSGSYLVWLYAHTTSADSLFLMVNDLIVPKLQVEERSLAELRHNAGVNASASQRRAIYRQEKFVGELRELREAVEAVAPLWAPDLNDGIVILLAPLWRLFAHHRTWSNELRKNWGKLAKGDCDWARLAMHLWPERVLPKCAEDRSLAIAHGLEGVFWAPDPDNVDRWLHRRIPATLIDQLIAERQSPAIAAAVQRVNT